MPAITFGGLASGLDTNSIISKLVALEKAPEAQINQNISDNQTKISLLGDISSKLQALQTAADALNLTSKTHPITATSSNTSAVTITGATSSTQGAFDIHVNALAKAQTTLSNQFASDTAGIAGTGTIDIAAGTATPVTISWDNTNSLTDIANKITASGAGVVASVLFDGSKYQIMVQSKQTGTANAISFTNQTGSDLGFSVGANTVVPASDADFTVNTIHIVRSSNLVSDVIPGVTFQLQSQGADSTVTLAPDTAGLQAKVQALVTAYNTVATAVHNQVSYTGDGSTQKPTNTLFGESSMLNLQQQLAGLVSTSYAYTGGNANIGGLGLTINADGTLAFDTAKFATAVAADPDAAQNLFNGSGSTGLVQALDTLVDNFTFPTTGVLSAAQTSLQNQNKSYNDSINNIEDRAAALQEQLTKQFSAMEQAVSALQSQSTYINQIGSVKSA
jgi:flagellar hook-associated protein 2